MLCPPDCASPITHHKSDRAQIAHPIEILAAGVLSDAQVYEVLQLIDLEKTKSRKNVMREEHKEAGVCTETLGLMGQAMCGCYQWPKAVSGIVFVHRGVRHELTTRASVRINMDV